MSSRDFAGRSDFISADEGCRVDIRVALAAGHRRIAISLVTGTLNSIFLHRGLLGRRLGFAQPDDFAGDLVDVPPERLGRFWFLGHARSINRELGTFNRSAELAPGPAAQPGRHST
jgi:hypothetical protein